MRSFVTLLGAWLALFSAQVVAEQCSVVYSGAVQTHGAGGKVRFSLNAHIEQTPSAVIHTSSVEGWGRKKACNDALCVANGQNTDPLVLPEFPLFETSRDLSIPAWGEAVAGAGPDNEFRHILLHTSAKLTFSPARTLYRIKTLDAAYGADIELSPGDYWIDDLSLGGANKITVSGSGKARLFVNRDLRIPTFAEINADTEDSSRLSFVINGELDQGGSSKVYALIYASGEYQQGSFSELGGVINASRVDLKHATKVIYQSAALNGAPLGMVCGPTGLEDQDSDGIPDHEDSDRDGDGISNTYEVATGTNPDDASSTPVDTNNNGIPDELEIIAFTNQCVAGFSNGLQSHGQDIQEPARDETGNIIFKLNSALQNASSPYLPAEGLVTRMASIKKSCGEQHCSYSGKLSSPLPDLSFQFTEGHRSVSVDKREEVTVGQDGLYDYQRIHAQARSTVRFTPGNYHIQTLDIDWGSTVYLAPGDYWIEQLDLGSGVEFVIEGEGTARLLVNNHVNLPWDTRMNWSGRDAGLASDLVLYGYKDVTLGSFGRLSGFLYAKGAVELGHASKTRGAVNGSHVLLRSDADVEYAPVDLGNADFGGICDIDNDGTYDGFDTDRDGDGISNDHETQLGFDPNDSSSTPADLDGDQIPDALDDDRDGDGVVNDSDAFPDDVSETADLDSDGIGDNADTDRDGDGISNEYETQLGFDPNDNSSTPPDLDGDQIPDLLDDDRDGDGVTNDNDAFPDDASETADLDSDGIGDNADTDRDGDSISNDHETQLGFDPNDSGSTPPDLDGDRLPDALDPDMDGDGVPNAGDAFSRDGSEWNDLDGDGIGDNSDPDRDGDGISNAHEVQLGFDPNDNSSTPPDLDGDRIPDALDEDRDGDGVNNDSDAFPDDASETADLDGDGIGDNADTDRDGDGVSNDHETQLGFDPNDSASTPPDLDGDQIPDALDEDRDGDGVSNDSDAFPDDASETADLDADGIGDNADTDRDGDGISNEYETQLGFDPNDNSSTPPDLDGDRIPDALDDDRDGDGVNNGTDAFPDDASETADLDGDGIGDNADTDRDGDGISNAHETQLGFDPNENSSTPPDLDGDRVPDALDDDRDGDGVNNGTDAFPDDASETTDLDRDGIGDNADTDRDGDGISNDHETQLGFDPNDNSSTPPDLDGDSIPDTLDEDRDGDGVNNGTDAFPDDASETADLDGDGIGDNADTDRDGDGISNEHETQLGFDPNDSSSTPPDLDGDRIPDALDDDRDGDGHANNDDAFPDDAGEWADLDGDGVGDNSDPDRDGDGISNIHEQQLGYDPNDASVTPPDLDGDHLPDALDDDRDGDGVNNDSDAFPDDASEMADLDGDGIGDNADTDRDGDGISNEYETQLGFDPNDNSSTPPDLDGDHIPDALDDDRDGDGVNNDSDAFPDDASETADLDGDGIGDNADTDRDGDGISNEHETQLGFDPNDNSSTPPDLDGDNIPDALDEDRDGDGVKNDTDAFPDDASETADLDGDGIGDNADTDRDGDGISNDYETQLGFDPNDNSSTPADLDGDGQPDALDDDRDGDGVNNDSDAFPDDTSETADLDGDGIGDNADTDRDGDGFSNTEEETAGTNPDDGSDYPDTTPPVITLNGPDSVSTESDLVTLTGLISDEGYGVQKVWATSDRYPATEFAVNLVNGSEWSASLPLEIGSNLVTLVGEDKAGNRSEKRITVEREDPDSFVGLTITAPSQNTRVSKDFVIVLGQARSDTPAANIQVTVAGEQAQLTATSQVTLFDFASPKVFLTEGVNAIPLVLDVDGELLQRTLIVIYEPEQPVYAEPVISVLAPVSGSQLADESFLLVADIEAEAGIRSIALNGETIVQPEGQPQLFSLREAVSFAGDSRLTLNVSVIDGQQQHSEQTITVTRDTGRPAILLDQPLVALPANNLVNEQPYSVSGTVVDANLSSFTINGSPVALAPAADGNGYLFSAALGLSSVSPQPLTLQARDQAGNRTTIEYSLQLSSDITLERILPADGLRLLGGEAQSLQVGARLIGVLSGITVAAELRDSAGTVVSATALDGDTSIRSGYVQVPATAGAYQLVLAVTDGTGQTISTTRSSLFVEQPEAVSLAVERMEPAPDSIDSEPNGFISLYFNRPIDPAEVNIEIFETAHGYTYIDNDAPGTDVLQAKGYELVNVARSHEAVPGELSILPGNQVLAFYPQRDLAYNGEVFVNVTVAQGDDAGKTLLRSRFQTRPLPTFIEGGVVDQFGQEVVGIEVAIPELGRTATTNKDGGFAFGFGDQPGDTLPAGRYELVINPGLKERNFGELKSWVNIDEGKRNRLGQLSVPVLNRDVAFSPVSGGRELSLLEGAIKLDLTDARLQFPDGRSQGDIHTQFLSFTELPYPVEPTALPMWVYAVQPAGVQVEGQWSLDIEIPQLNNGWEHVPPDNTLVLLVGLDKTSRMIAPVGVGRINNYRVQSTGTLQQTQLDVMGYAIVSPQRQPLLAQYVRGEISFTRLLGEITAARHEEARAYQAQAASNTNNQN